MRWLPRAVHFFFFDEIEILDGWWASALPRELRCLHLAYCKQPFGNTVPKYRRIEFDKLPRKMEELIIDHGWLSGLLFYVELPQTMYLCVFIGMHSAKAYFDNL